jgi:3-isopropylmalate/(R)-2-methylmalate dehydratase large subunit
MSQSSFKMSSSQFSPLKPPPQSESRTIIDKIWDSHVVGETPGHPTVFSIDFMLIHEVTSAQAFDVCREKGIDLFDTSRLLATLDHSIPTRKNRFEIFDDSARNQVETLRRNCKDFDVPLADFDSGYQGIVHVIGPELGITQPGMTIVCGDSHTSTHGAFGALAFGVGTTEVGMVLATHCILASRPKTFQVAFEGKLPPGVFAKDMILRLIAEIGIAGANGHIIEYTGSAVRSLTMEERMTICNMSIECGARAGLIAPDNVTFEYLKGKPCVPKDSKWNDAVQHWLSLTTDENASYDREITIDVSELKPMVTWGTNPEQALEIDKRLPQVVDLPLEKRSNAKKALEYVQLREGDSLQEVSIQWAFIGSCTNGRIEDLRLAASVLSGRHIHPSVTMYIVPGSEAVLAQARHEGLINVFEQAGAIVRMPGCSMCLGMNDDKVPPGERCISSSNRNFVGRQGTGSITHLASPATVAESAIQGRIASFKVA